MVCRGRMVPNILDLTLQDKDALRNRKGLGGNASIEENRHRRLK
jgi:hypothetical protein